MCMHTHIHTHTHTYLLFAAVVTCQRVKVYEPCLININVYFGILVPEHCHSVK